MNFQIQQGSVAVQLICNMEDPIIDTSRISVRIWQIENCSTFIEVIIKSQVSCFQHLTINIANRDENVANLCKLSSSLAFYTVQYFLF